MARAYARCRAYRDVGVLRTRTLPSNRPEYTLTKPFSTVFVRPDRFRFEYRDRLSPDAHETRRVVWACAGEVRALVDSGHGRAETESPPSLFDHLRALGGTSGRLSWVAPYLLLPEWGQGQCWHLANVERLDDGAVSDEGCYRVKGAFATAQRHDEVGQQAVRETFGQDAVWDGQSGPVTFWIEKRRMLLRRFESTLRLDALRLRADVVADYEPEIDISISESELAFDSR